MAGSSPEARRKTARGPRRGPSLSLRFPLTLASATAISPPPLCNTSISYSRCLPPPLPALVLGSRIGYLPLLIPLVKPHFYSTLPPGVDIVWFDYEGLPLKWYIPIGVLFDLLCPEPERPWSLTVHFRGYPAEILTPCDGEESVKWSYINSLKEAAYIISGNCKSIMLMSQAD